LFTGIIRDIAERKRFEEALERLSRQHGMVLEAVGEGIFGLDLHSNVTFVNPAASDKTGWSTQDLPGQPMHNLVHHTKPDETPYPSEECPIHAAFTTGTTHSRDDEVFWRKDGTSFPVEYTSNPIFEDGEIVGAVVTFRDITERKALKEQLVLDESEIDPASLQLEITEGAMTTNGTYSTDRTLRNLKR
jgi:PAS domain S-box-containing protein